MAMAPLSGVAMGSAPSPAITARGTASMSKPILRRPPVSSGTARRTRAEAGFEDDDNDDEDGRADMPLPSLKKRARVTFDPRIDEQDVVGRNVEREKEPLLPPPPPPSVLRAEIRAAIDEKRSKGGDAEAYDALRERFASRGGQRRRRRRQRQRRGHGGEWGEENEAEVNWERGDDDDDAEDVVEPASTAHVVALTNMVAALGADCAALIRAMLGCEWVGREESFVKAYVQFLGNLISAHGTYVSPVLKMLVEKLVEVKLSSGRLPNCPSVSRAVMAARVHGALQYLLRLIPSASSRLSPLLATNFPAPEDARRLHITYIKNLLRTVEYAPELRTEVLALITDRLVKLDVQMQVDLDDVDDNIAVTALHALTLRSAKANANRQAYESDEDDSDAESISGSDSGADDDNDDVDDGGAPGLAAHLKKAREVQESVCKLDSILDIMFATYAPYFAVSHSSNNNNNNISNRKSNNNGVATMTTTTTTAAAPSSAAAGDAAFELLLAHFAGIVLPAYRSRHTQFLLFHFAQTTRRRVEHFAGACVALAFDRARPAALRHAAAAYLASFVARGARVPARTVARVFALVGRQLAHLRAAGEATCRGPDLRRYGTFYALTQALLYIFCFRWRDLAVAEGEDDDDDAAAAADDDDDDGYYGAGGDDARNSSPVCAGTAEGKAPGRRAGGHGRGEDAAEETEGEEDPLVAMLQLGQDITWRAGVRETLRRAVYSKLNPLKVCSPTVVEEFARRAHQLRLVYVYPLLETNKRVRLSQFALATGAAGAAAPGVGARRDAGFGAGRCDDAWHQLDAHFPFDPYQLPGSKRWLAGDYVDWREIPGLQPWDSGGEESDDDDDDDDDDGVDEDDEEARANGAEVEEEGEEEDTATDGEN